MGHGHSNYDTRGSAQLPLIWRIGSVGSIFCCGPAVEGNVDNSRLRFGRGDFLESLMQKLFLLHDLNCNGLLEESELIWLNEKLAVLHHGHDIDMNSVKSKYRGLFRSKLDPNGYAVPYATFRAYTISCLDALDPLEQAQEMIMERFVAEADLARHCFSIPAIPCAFTDEEDDLLGEIIGLTMDGVSHVTESSVIHVPGVKSAWRQHGLGEDRKNKKPFTSRSHQSAQIDDDVDDERALDMSGKQWTVRLEPPRGRQCRI
mmetsp:Transcript_7917/g.12955  ORF Transcript_7917/g.12955 Transcript_7917/m.12955 type:complete len:260 (-) Transcript_7917:122-901(-)